MKKEKKGSKFLRNTATLVSGNIIAQLITVCLIPVVTRLYPPDVYGYFGTFLAIVVILRAFATLRYHVAIQLPIEENEADAVGLLSILLVICMCLLMIFPFVTWGFELSKALKLRGVVWILYLIPAGVLLQGMTLILIQWYLRAGSFRNLAKSKVAGAIGDKAVAIGIGFLSVASPIGLIGGRLTGNIIALASLILSRIPRSVWNIFSLSSIQKVRVLAIRYKEFPKYSWAALIQQAGRQMPIILLGIFFSPAVVGFFVLARRVLGEPMALIGQEFSSSFFQRAAQLHRAGRDLSDMSVRLLRYLTILVLFPLLLFGVVSEEAFGLVFGERWQEAGIFAKVLVPMFVAGFLLATIGTFFDLLEKQKERLIFSVIFFASSTTALVAGGLTGTPILAIGLFSMVATVVNVYRIFWVMSKIGVRTGQSARILCSAFALSGAFATPAALLKYLWHMSSYVVLIGAALSISLFGIFLLLTDDYLRTETISFIRR